MKLYFKKIYKYHNIKLINPKLLCGELEVSVPLAILLEMFSVGLASLQKLESRAMRRREASHSFSDGGEGMDSEQAHYQQALNSTNANSFTVFDTYDAYKVCIVLCILF